MENDSVQLIAFSSITFAITYILEIWLWLSGGLTVWFASAILTGIMFVPLFSAVVAVRLIGHRNLRSYGIARGRLRYYLYSLLYPFVVIALGLVVIAVLGTPSIDFTLSKLKEVFPNVPVTTKISVYLIVINLILAPFINFIPAFGEEYGWRGFLLPKLVRRWGILAGFLVTGTIWGVWHGPLVLMSYNYPHHPDLFGVAAFTVWCILAGFFLGWLRLKSSSVFPVALGHGAINAYIGFGFLIAHAVDEMTTIPFGPPGMLALLLIAILAYVDLSRSTRS